jgi:hypothetical protein
VARDLAAHVGRRHAGLSAERGNDRPVQVAPGDRLGLHGDAPSSTRLHGVGTTWRRPPTIVRQLQQLRHDLLAAPTTPTGGPRDRHRRLAAPSTGAFARSICTEPDSTASSEHARSSSPYTAERPRTPKSWASDFDQVQPDFRSTFRHTSAVAMVARSWPLFVRKFVATEIRSSHRVITWQYLLFVYARNLRQPPDFIE